MKSKTIINHTKTGLFRYSYHCMRGQQLEVKSAPWPPTFRGIEDPSKPKIK